MSDDRPSKRSTSFSDLQFVEISGPSVHTPGELAKPRPADRPREVIPLEEHRTQFVELDDSGEDRGSSQID